MSDHADTTSIVGSEPPFFPSQHTSITFNDKRDQIPLAKITFRFVLLTLFLSIVLSIILYSTMFSLTWYIKLFDLSRVQLSTPVYLWSRGVDVLVYFIIFLFISPLFAYIYRNREYHKNVEDTAALRQVPSFDHILPNAELLLSYAAATGKTLREDDVKILTHEIERYKADNKEIKHQNGNHNYATILHVYSRVAKDILLVTAETLCECTADARRTLRYNAVRGSILVIVVLLASFFAFVSSTMSDSIKTRLGQPGRFSPWGMAEMLRVGEIGGELRC